jgi:hypothetical protein
VITNAEIIEFPSATGAWGTITHFALYDASSGGNVLAFGTLGVEKEPTDGDTPRFAAGLLSTSLD